MEVDVSRTVLKVCSFLQARDPSVLAWHSTDVRKNLFEGEVSKECSETLKSPADHLEVFLRLKKIKEINDIYQIAENKVRCRAPEAANAARNCRDGESIAKEYVFSNIFDQNIEQTAIFNEVVKSKVLHFINGLNCSLLAYGASGSGKTFTIIGTAEDPGILPRALEYLFRTLPTLSQQPRVKPAAGNSLKRLSDYEGKNEREKRLNFLRDCGSNIDNSQHIKTYRAMQKRLSVQPAATLDALQSDVSLGVWISFVEIYNEHIYDLLQPQPLRGQARQKLRLGQSDGTTFVKDATWINVSAGLEAYLILQYGLHNLNYAATNINDHSSRSHCIFSIKLVQACDSQEGIGVSSFNFCDLAGSERLKKTLNVGMRLKETNNINTSLMVLGRCISEIRNSQKNNDNRLIPFRESKLTQFFQRALLGYEAIAMMVNINPVRNMYDESQHVLNFSAIAKDVVVEKQNPVKRPPTTGFYQNLQYRSTEVNAIREEDSRDDQIAEMASELERAYSIMEELKIEYQEDRDYVIETYKKILKDSEDTWQYRFDRMKKYYTTIIAKLKEEKAESINGDVIILDSSDEEDEMSTTVLPNSPESFD